MMDTNEKNDTFAVPTASDEDARLLAKYAKRFTGCYPHSLDTKGRVVIPQAFREGLGNPFTIAPAQDFSAICLYNNLEWARVRERYEQYGNNSKIKKFLVLFDAFSYHDQEFDSQGRILVPIRIRKQILGEDKDIEISGANNCVRITTSQSFGDLITEVLGSMDDIEGAIDEADIRLQE